MAVCCAVITALQLSDDLVRFGVAFGCLFHLQAKLEAVFWGSRCRTHQPPAEGPVHDKDFQLARECCNQLMPACFHYITCKQVIQAGWQYPAARIG